MKRSTFTRLAERCFGAVIDERSNAAGQVLDFIVANATQCRDFAQAIACATGISIVCQQDQESENGSP